MKKHISVLMLFVRSSMYRFLLIIFIMAAVQTVFFTISFRNAEGLFGLDTILSASYLGISFAVSFLVLYAQLCLTGCEFGGKHSYTLSRLRVSQKAILIWRAVCNAGFLIMFWAAQVGIILAFGGLFTARYPQPQAVMLVFYQNNFLHNLLPLADWSRIVLNIGWLVVLAVTATDFPIRINRGQKWTFAPIVGAFFPLSFMARIASPITNLFFAALLLTITILCLRGDWKGEKNEEFS